MNFQITQFIFILLDIPSISHPVFKNLLLKGYYAICVA